MIGERIIFNILAFILFIAIFYKMINKNDTNYTYVLITQAIGIAISFIGLVFRINLNIIVIIITYIISVLLPISIIIFENKGIYLSEIIYMNLSRFYCKKDNYEKAKEILKIAIEKFPNSYYLHKELGNVYEKNGNDKIAVDELIRASEINEEDDKLKIKTAELLTQQSRTNEAEIVLNNMLKTDPKNYNASLMLSDLLYEKGNYMDAITVCMQSLNYNTDQYEIYYNLGILFTAINDFQTAREYYQKAAELNSLLYHAKYNLGQIALLYNELEEAEDYFNQCIDEDDISDDVYYYLSYLSMLKGDREEAIQYLNISVEFNEELYEKACKEPVFGVIISRINKPTNNPKSKKVIAKKEKQTMRHLEETCAVVGNLNHNDLRVLRSIREKEKEQEKEKEKKEKQEEKEKIEQKKQKKEEKTK